MNTPSLDKQITARNTKRYTRPGFSLIELTAVLVILGLLMAGAAISIPNLMNRSKIRITKTSMTTIKTAVNTYMADYTGNAPESVTAMIPNYLDQGADKDSWGNLYHFIATPGGTHAYELVSLGADGEPGTSDDINVWTMDVTSGN